MAAQYYTLLTAAGIAKIANAGATGGTVNLTHIALGDGNGTAVTPTETATALVHEVHRGPINHLYVPSTDPAQIAAELVVLPNVGGWTIREVGVYDDDGDLLIYGSHPAVYKPVLAEGSGMDLTVVVRALVGNGAPVQLKIDQAVVLATRAWVLDVLGTHKTDPAGHPVVTQEANGFMGSAMLNGLMPPGAVAHFALSSAPAGWLKCNGATISRVTYADLFAAIGTTFGAGDGSTTFNLPDLRGEFLRGLDDGRGVDASRALGSAQGHSLQSHNHQIPTGGGNDPCYGITDTSWVYGSNNSPVSGQYATTYPVAEAANINGTIGTFRAETRPRNIALLACIKY